MTSHINPVPKFLLFLPVKEADFEKTQDTLKGLRLAWEMSCGSRQMTWPRPRKSGHLCCCCWPQDPPINNEVEGWMGGWSSSCSKDSGKTTEGGKLLLFGMTQHTMLHLSGLITSFLLFPATGERINYRYYCNQHTYLFTWKGWNRVLLLVVTE